jgi:crotonobetainyl-CoA:carnitine CoA-transferase CaiB-like acyl-CoA transferase
MRRPEAKAILARLIEQSDVLVENFRPGVLARLGFSEVRLKELRPSLVACSINGFGSAGPYKDRPAFDFIAQAMSGFMSVNGGPDDPPLRSGLPISDLVAGLYAALSIAAAARAGDRAGPAGGGQPDQRAGQLAVVYRDHLLRHGRGAGPQRQRSPDRGAVWIVPDPGRPDRAGTRG